MGPVPTIRTLSRGTSGASAALIGEAGVEVVVDVRRLPLDADYA